MAKKYKIVKGKVKRQMDYSSYGIGLNPPPVEPPKKGRGKKVTPVEETPAPKSQKEGILEGKQLSTGPVPGSEDIIDYGPLGTEYLLEEKKRKEREALNAKLAKERAEKPLSTKPVPASADIIETETGKRLLEEARGVTEETKEAVDETGIEKQGLLKKAGKVVSGYRQDRAREYIVEQGFQKGMTAEQVIAATGSRFEGMTDEQKKATLAELNSAIAARKAAAAVPAGKEGDRDAIARLYNPLLRNEADIKREWVKTQEAIDRESTDIPILSKDLRVAQNAYERIDTRIDGYLEAIKVAETEKIRHPKETEALNNKIAELTGKIEDAKKEQEPLFNTITTNQSKINEIMGNAAVARKQSDRLKTEMETWNSAYLYGLEKQKKAGKASGVRRALYEIGEAAARTPDITGTKFKQVTDVLAEKPIGDVGKGFEKVLGRGTPGYREGHSVTDIVGGGGTTEGRLATLANVTSLRSTGVSRMGIPTARARGIPVTPQLTTNIRGIDVGDISAMGIKVRKDTVIPLQTQTGAVTQPALERTRLMELDSSYVGQYPGQPSWQKAKTRTRKFGRITVPSLGGIKTPSVAGHLDLGKAAVGSPAMLKMGKGFGNIEKMDFTGISSQSYTKITSDHGNIGLKSIKIGINNLLLGRPKASKAKRRKKK